MKISLSCAFIALLGALAVSATAGPVSICDGVSGNLVTNCGFETGDFTGWSSGGNFEDTEVVSTVFYDYTGANSGTFYTVMGAIGDDGTLSQTLATTLGETYTFSFFLASVGDDPSDFSASWDGTSLLALGDPNTGTGYTEFSYSVVGTGSDTIQFSFRDDPAYLALDDVSVAPADSGVPEPGTMGMLFGGLGFVVAGIRRRRTARSI